jgi:hypothetical protein
MRSAMLDSRSDPAPPGSTIVEPESGMSVGARRRGTGSSRGADRRPDLEVRHAPGHVPCTDTAASPADIAMCGRDIRLGGRGSPGSGTECDRHWASGPTSAIDGRLPWRRRPDLGPRGGGTAKPGPGHPGEAGPGTRPERWPGDARTTGIDQVADACGIGGPTWSRPTGMSRSSSCSRHHPGRYAATRLRRGPIGCGGCPATVPRSTPRNS